MRLSDKDFQQQTAWRMVREALESGVLSKPEACEECGARPESPLHGHHHNGYGPGHEIDVRWLCAGCHARTHRDDHFRHRGRVPKKIIHVSLPETVVEEIDDYAASCGVSRATAIAVLLYPQITRVKNGDRPRDDVQQSA